MHRVVSRNTNDVEQRSERAEMRWMRRTQVNTERFCDRASIVAERARAAGQPKPKFLKGEADFMKPLRIGKC